MGLIAYLLVGWAISYGIATILWQVLDLDALAYAVLSFGGGLIAGHIATRTWLRRKTWR